MTYANFSSLELVSKRVKGGEETNIKMETMVRALRTHARENHPCVELDKSIIDVFGRGDVYGNSFTQKFAIANRHCLYRVEYVIFTFGARFISRLSMFGGSNTNQSAFLVSFHWLPLFRLVQARPSH